MVALLDAREEGIEVDQQLRITRVMIDAVRVPQQVDSPKLAKYMDNYLAMMMCICSIFLRMIDTAEAEQKRKDIWQYLKDADAATYKRIRRSVLNLGVNIPTRAGRKVGVAGYHLAQKIFKFN